MATVGDGSSGAQNKRLTIAFIGAKNVGKTSIIKFVGNTFSDSVASTTSANRYRTSVVTNNNRIIEVQISDFPAIPKFPEDSLQEWNIQCQQKDTAPHTFCRLRQASAYVLVFDASRPAATFQYIRQMREQILQFGGPDVHQRPIVVAANKQDLVVHKTANKCGRSTQNHHRPGGHQANGKTGTWKPLFIETSAKFNWQVVHLFQQVLSAIDSATSEGVGKGPGENRIHHPMHLLHLPHLAHLVHLGTLNDMPISHTQPALLPPPTGQAARQNNERSRSRLRENQQCPVC